MVIDLYNIFTEKVASGRGMEIDKVHEAAQGRIFSGIRALEKGLVDSVGGLSDALRIARNIAEIPEDKRAVYKKYPEPTFMEQLMSSFSSLSVKVKNEYSLTDLFLPDADVRYLLMNNGRAMPILSAEFY